MPGDPPGSSPRPVPSLKVSRAAAKADGNPYVRYRARRSHQDAEAFVRVCIRDAKEAFSVKPRFPEKFEYLTLDVQDNEEQNLIRMFPQSVLVAIKIWLATEMCVGQSLSSTLRSLKVAASSFIAMVRPSYLLSWNKMLTARAGGISLSPAFVIMFVMQHYQISWEEALHYVQNRRYCISPNSGFITQIKVGSKKMICNKS